MTIVNLIPHRYVQRRKVAARQRVWIIAGMIYVVTIGVAYLFARARWNNDDRDGTNTIRLMQADIAVNEKSVAKSTQQVNEYASALKELSQITDQPDWGLLLGVVAKMCGEETVLSKCVITAPKNSSDLPVVTAHAAASTNANRGAANGARVLELQGYGNSQKAVTQFALQLEKSGLFENVTIGKTSRESFGKFDAVAFRMECPLKQVSEAVRTPASNRKTAPAEKPANRLKGRPENARPLSASSPHGTVAGTREAGEE